MRIVDRDEAELFVVFDFSCIAYRAFYSKEEDKEAYVVRRILKNLKTLPEIKLSIFFALDGDFLTKKIIYPDYKGNRPKLSVNPKEEYLKYLNYFRGYTLKNDSEEADDVICSFIRSNPNKPIIVVTADSDLSHLNSVNNVVVMNERTGEVLEAENYFKNASINETHLTLYKATFGDTSDNIKPICPRLRKADFHSLLWMYSHDPKTYIKEALNLIKKSKSLSEQEAMQVQVNFLKNYELVLPRWNITFDTLDTDFEIPPTKNSELLFLREFLVHKKPSSFRLI